MTKTIVALALAGALIQPATATTFPTLTTIYVVPGLFDNGSADFQGTATAVHCSNVSGQTSQLKFLFLNSAGAVARNITTSLSHGQSRIVSTHDTFLFSAETNASTGTLFAGAVLNIESTESGVFCTAMIVDAAAGETHGIALHPVRVNPHPGTVE